jgi:hypothetical protein
MPCEKTAASWKACFRIATNLSGYQKKDWSKWDSAFIIIHTWYEAVKEEHTVSVMNTVIASGVKKYLLFEGNVNTRKL